MKIWKKSKKIVSLLLVGILMIAAVSPTQPVSAEAADANSITNITFDDGALPEGVSTPTSYTEIVASPGERTGYSLKSNWHTGNGGILKIAYPMQNGHTYEVKVDAYFEPKDTTKDSYNTWFVIYADDDVNIGGNDSTGGENVWKTTTKTYTAKKDTTFLKLIANTTNGYFDNIIIKDVTPKPFTETLSYNFANGAPTGDPVLVAGSSSSITYKYDETLGQTVAECKLGGNFGASGSVYVPYLLKAGKQYDITMTYKTSAWCCAAFFSPTVTSGDAGSSYSWNTTSYTTGTTTITTPTTKGDQLYFGISTTSGNAGATISIASISIKEHVTNSADYQMYDFDTNWKTSTSTVEADGNGVKSKVLYLNHTFENLTLDAQLTQGESYKLSFDYKGYGQLWMFNYVSTPYDVMSARELTSDTWQSYELYFTAKVTTTAFTIRNTHSSTAEHYIDNVCIEKVTPCTVSVTESVTGGTATMDAPNLYVGEQATFTANAEIGYVFKGWESTEGVIVSSDSVYTVTLEGDIALTPVFESLDKKAYYEDFENADHNTLRGSDKVTVEYVDDATYGKVAALKFISGTMGTSYDKNEVKIPYKLLPGKNYKVTVCYKFAPDVEKESAAFYPYEAGDANSLGTWLGATEWTTFDRIITGRDDGKSVLRFSSVNSGTLYIASISITYGTGITGDVDGDKYVTAADVDLFRKHLVGNPDVTEDIYPSALDVNGDNAVDVRDLVRLIKEVAKATPTTAMVDETNDLTKVAYSQGVVVNTQNNLGDASVFRLASSADQAYLVYKIDEGITEGAVQYDFSETFVKDGGFKFEVSADGVNYTEVEAQDVASIPLTGLPWVQRTAYFGNINHMPYFKITFPQGYKVTTSPGIRKVQFNVLSETALADIGGYNSKLRKAKTIYVDSANGADSNAGTEAKPLQTLAAVAEKNLVPGDKVLLKSGGTYIGNVTLVCSGTKANPITIGSYGTGEKPLITNFEGATGLCITGEYVTVENLKFSSETGLSGLDFYAVGEGANRGLTVRGCEFVDINCDQYFTGKVSYLNGGVHFIARGNQPTWFEDILVENNTFNKVARTAIYVTSYWAARDTAEQADGKSYQNYNFAIPKDAGIPTEYLSKNVIVRNNTVTNNGGDAIMLNGVDGGLVEYNTVADTKLFYQYRDSANQIWSPAFAAVWCYCSDNVVFQYNEVSGTSGANGGTDLQAFDIDFASRNCTVQYNYSHDNDGGFVLLCATDAANGGAVDNAIVRFNLSVNDGGTSNEIRDSVATAVTHGVFDVVRSVRNAHIYNNTVYCTNSGGAKYKLIKFSNYTDTAATEKISVTVENNIFYAANAVPSGQSWWSYNGNDGTSALLSAVFDSNVMYNIDTPSAYEITVTNPVSTIPQFVAGGTTPDGRAAAGANYRTDSALSTAGKVIADNGGYDYLGTGLPENCKLIGAIYQ